MKINPDELKLLNAALADESWHSFQSGLRTKTTGALRSTRRRRLVISYTFQLVALVFAIAAAWSTFGPSSRTLSSQQNHSQLQANSQTQPAPATTTTASYITQDQMLSLFPKDTCVLAEINDQPQLVFFDPAHARDGFDLASN